MCCQENSLHLLYFFLFFISQSEDWLSIFSIGQSVHFLVDDASDLFPLLKIVLHHRLAERRWLDPFIKIFTASSSSPEPQSWATKQTKLFLPLWWRRFTEYEYSIFHSLLLTCPACYMTNRNCDCYLYFWVPYINWFQFAHSLLIECRNVHSPCIILTEYGYGGLYLGGTSAGQVSPPLPLVSGFRVLLRLLRLLMWVLKYWLVRFVVI